MLVKKVNPDWKPSENKALEVGETIEITDPKQLIVSGMVVGIGKHGEELSAYEMYGVLVDTELKDFEEFVKMKKATAIKAQLEKEQEALEKELAKSEDATAVAVEVAKEAEAEAKTVEKPAKKTSKK